MTGGACLSLASAGALAQDDEDLSDVIFVTGEKVERSLQDTSTSVDVTTSQDIIDLNIVDLSDVLRRVGNAGFVTTGRGNNEQFTLRGVSSGGVTPGTNTPVATLYIDGAVVPNQAAGATVSNAWDVQQFEVLRGAQSTVQGRNSLIGAIHVTTVDPTNDWDWSAQARYGEYNTYDLAGAFGGPIIEDQLLFRIAGQYAESDGFVERPDGSDGDEEDTTVLRGKMIFTPEAIPALEARLTAIYTDETDGIVVVDAADLEARRQFADVAGQVERELNLYSLNVDYEVNDVISLVSLTTYSKLETNEVSDFDGLPDLVDEVVVPTRFDQREETDFQQEVRLVFEAGAFSGLVGALYAERKSDSTTQVDDIFPLGGIADLDLSVLALNGVYQNAVFNATGDNMLLMTAPAGVPTTLGSSLLLGQSVDLNSQFLFQPEFETTALFADVTWEVTDALSLSGGFRWEREDATYNGLQTNAIIGDDAAARTPTGQPGLADTVETALTAALTPGLGGVDAAAVAATATPEVVQGYADVVTTLFQLRAGETFFSGTEIVGGDEFDVFLPKFVGTYDVNEDLSFSLSAQKAYRPGGLGLNPVANAIYTFDPEFAWNYEAAMRFQTADGRLTLNANAFLIDWTDQQIEVQLDPTPQNTEVRNVGESELYGAEFQLDYVVNDYFSLFGTLGLLHTEITNDDRTDFLLEQGVTEEEIAALSEDELQPLKGDSFTFAPDTTATLGVTYNNPNGLSATVDVNYQSESIPLLQDKFCKRFIRSISIR